MQILVYSETTGASVAANLGQAEYSYFFILNKYRPVLERLGTVVPVEHPETEVDALYTAARERGEACVFLSFTPPHRTVRDTACPTAIVLAWEFDRIPDESWDGDTGNNWVEAIREVGAVVTISEYASRVVRRQVGPKVLVATIPAPVDVATPVASGWRQLIDSPARPAAEGGPGGERALSLDAGIIDTRTLSIDAEGVSPLSGGNEALQHSAPRWPGHPVHWDFSQDGGGDSQYLLGFYEEEYWGSWSKTTRPSVILPWVVAGAIELELELQGYGDNVGRELRVVLGEQERCVVLPPELERHTLRFELPDAGATRIQFLGLSPVPAARVRDHRTLGLGLASLWLRRVGGDTEAPATENPDAGLMAPRDERLSLNGIVYTSVFNPVDGRKNWIDMVTAFCWAFRDREDRTLILKMSHRNPATFLGKLLLMFSHLWPFRCRIIALHGYLPDEQLEQLIDATDFFVNTSVAEGQCLPLLECMARGVPAVSPDHTAMQTYISPRNSFVVRSTVQPYRWPTDPRRAYRTLSYRIDWESLCQAYSASAEVEAPLYQRMSGEARRAVRKYYSSDLVGRRLNRLLRRLAKRGRR